MRNDITISGNDEGGEDTSIKHSTQTAPLIEIARQLDLPHCSLVNRVNFMKREQSFGDTAESSYRIAGGRPRKTYTI